MRGECTRGGVLHDQREAMIGRPVLQWSSAVASIALGHLIPQSPRHESSVNSYIKNDEVLQHGILSLMLQYSYSDIL